MTTLKKPASIDISAILGLCLDVAPLYHRYPGQHYPQDAFIEIDERGVVTAFSNPEIGNAVPAAVFLSHTLRFDITPYVSGDDLADLIGSDEVVGLLTRLYEGHTVEWDGNNHRGKLTFDAKRARDELADIFEQVQPSEETVLAISEAEAEEQEQF